MRAVFSGGQELTRHPDQTPMVPPQLGPYLKHASKRGFVLRRAALLLFIHSDPADRFRQIAALIGIDSLDSKELALQRVRDQAAGERKIIDADIKTKEGKLKGLLGTPNCNDGTVIAAVNQLLLQSGQPEVSDLSNLQELASSIAAREHVVDPRLVSLERLRIAFQQAPEVLQLYEEYVALAARLNDLLATTDVDRELASLSLLESGEAYLGQFGVAECPLCESPIDRDETLERVRVRLGLLRQLRADAAACRQSAAALSLSSSGMVTALESLLTDSAAVLGDSDIKVITDLAQGVRVISDATSKARTLHQYVPLDIRPQIAAFAQLLDRMPEIIEAAKTGLALPKDEEERASRIAMVIEAYQVFSLLCQLRDQQTGASLLEQRAKEVYEAFSDAKRTEVEAIYRAIQDDVNRFYKLIHGSDEHDNVTLIVKRRASTELGLDIFGLKGEDPRGMASEAHLDTLGLSIFLAFAKRFNGSCTLLMLDDVIMSVDGGHRQKVAELLLSEFAGYQLLLTTHDRIWYEELRAHQDSAKLSSKFVNLEITGWSRERGLSIRPYKPRWERIQERLCDGDATGAGSEGRRYLEWLLGEICSRSRAKVEYKLDGLYTVNDFWQPACSRLRGLMKSQMGELDAALSALGSTKILGNLTSHNRVETTELTVPEVREFCEAVKGLHVLFSCPECSQLLAYDQDRRELHCPNQACGNPARIQRKG